MTAPVAYYCKPCGGTDATPETVLAVKGTCERCGAQNVTLYRVPARPLLGVGLEAR